MRYITIKAFKFDELSEKAKENARENLKKLRNSTIIYIES